MCHSGIFHVVQNDPFLFKRKIELLLNILFLEEKGGILPTTICFRLCGLVLICSDRSGRQDSLIPASLLFFALVMCPVYSRGLPNYTYVLFVGQLASFQFFRLNTMDTLRGDNVGAQPLLCSSRLELECLSTGGGDLNQVWSCLEEWERHNHEVQNVSFQE